MAPARECLEGVAHLAQRRDHRFGFGLVSLRTVSVLDDGGVIRAWEVMKALDAASG
jgi:hypothetical protein